MASTEDTVGETKAHCPDCQGEMAPIQVLVEIDRATIGGLDIQRVLYYTVADAHRSIWTGRFPIEGKVQAMMCSGCGRINFRGVPSK